jgi:hypothetical protein
MSIKLRRSAMKWKLLFGLLLAAGIWLLAPGGTSGNQIVDVSDHDSAAIVGGACEDFEISTTQYTCGGGPFLGLKFWEYCSNFDFHIPEAANPNAYNTVASATCSTSCGYGCGTGTCLIPCDGY